MNVPETEKGRVMHVSLPIGSAVLMGSDSCSVFDPPPVIGTNIEISLIGESREHCDEVCGKLSQGGLARLRLRPTRHVVPTMMDG